MNDMHEDQQKIYKDIMSLVHFFNILDFEEEKFCSSQKIIKKLTNLLIKYPEFKGVASSNIGFEALQKIFRFDLPNTVFHFLSLMIETKKFRDYFLLENVYDLFIKKYFQMCEINKDFTRLLFVNLSTCNIQHKEYV